MINRLNCFIIAYEKVFHFHTLFTNKFNIFVIRIFNQCLLKGLVKKRLYQILILLENYFHEVIQVKTVLNELWFYISVEFFWVCVLAKMFFIFYVEHFHCFLIFFDTFCIFVSSAYLTYIVCRVLVFLLTAFLYKTICFRFSILFN